MWICEKPGLGGCKVVWEFGNFWLGRGGSLNFGDFARWAVLLYLDYISIISRLCFTRLKLLSGRY